MRKKFFFHLWLLALGTLGSGTAAQLKAELLNQGEQAYKKGDFATASQYFLDKEITAPENLQHAYNRAVSQFQERKYAEAASGFAKAAAAADPDLSLKASYNLGAAKIALGDLKGAIEAYDAALKLRPDHQASQDNKAWAQQQLKKQQEQKDKEQDSAKDNKHDQGKDQQDQQDQQKNPQDQADQNKDQAQDQGKDQEQQKNAQNQANQNKDQGQSKEQDQEPQKSAQDHQQKKDQAQEGKNQQQEQGKEQKEQGQTGQQQASQATQEQELKPGEISQEAALRLLRSLEDSEEYYGRPPKIEQPETTPEKDW